jgi:hypothetical protein
VPAGWMTADEADGGSPGVARLAGGCQLPYVLAVQATEPLPSASGPPAPAAGWPGASRRTAGGVPAPAMGPRAAGWYAWTACRSTALAAWANEQRRLGDDGTVFPQPEPARRAAAAQERLSPVYTPSPPQPTR